MSPSQTACTNQPKILKFKHPIVLQLFYYFAMAFWLGSQVSSDI